MKNTITTLAFLFCTLIVHAQDAVPPISKVKISLLKYSEQNGFYIDLKGNTHQGQISYNLLEAESFHFHKKAGKKGKIIDASKVQSFTINDKFQFLAHEGTFYRTASATKKIQLYKKYSLIDTVKENKEMVNVRVYHYASMEGELAFANIHSSQLDPASEYVLALIEDCSVLHHALKIRFIEKQYKKAKDIRAAIWSDIASFYEDCTPETEIQYVEIEEELPIIEDPLYTIVENMPEFPGGESAMFDFIRKNLAYPEEAKAAKITGTVYIGYIVNKDGSISDVKVLRGIGRVCDEEAKRMFESMPNWSPGTQRGKPVRVQCRMPVKFVFQ